jgi:ribosomal protein S18 acetylase RimI-like enzyme
MQVHEHPTTSPSLQQALKSALPYSINLVYRTQHANRTEHAYILATFHQDAKVPKCWAAAYLDRAMRPETELWIFAAGELPNHSSSEGFCLNCKKAVLSLLDYMSTLPTPPMRPDNLPALDLAYQHEKEFPTPGPDGEYPAHPGTFMRHLLDAMVILVGACPAPVVDIMRENGLIRRDMPGAHLELNKFVFKLSDLPATRELPKGLRWGEVREQDIETVKARTNIPRSAKTLLSLKSMGVFEGEGRKPVAWTFLGLDGSLTTLHTEPEHRGKGIAKAVAAKIIREYAPGLAVDERGNAWSHADVYLGNIQSEIVCRSLGGKALWKDYWVRIDLEKAGNLAKGA